MRKALVRLDELITTSIDPASIDTTGSSDALLKYTHAALAECDSIEKDLLHNPAKPTGSESFQLFIHHYQTDLVCLCDIAYSYRQRCTEPSACLLYDKIVKRIASVLLSLQCRRPNYFDYAGKAPDSYQLKIRQQLQGGWPALHRRIQALRLSEGLLGCVAEPIEAFLSNQCPAGITWHLLNYYKSMAQELSHWAAKDPDSPEWELLRLLVRLNFNTTTFCSWCNDYLTAILDEVKDTAGKLNGLNLLCKLFLFQQPIRGMDYEPAAESIKRYIERWIAVETNSIKEMELLVPGANKAAPARGLAGLRKLLLPFTVGQWGLWIRMKLESGLIGKVAIEEAMDILAPTHETAQQKDISSRSMREKSANPALKDFEFVMDKAALLFVNTLNYGKSKGYDMTKWSRYL